eukprot:4701975-Amphidinium_carterae.1
MPLSCWLLPRFVGRLPELKVDALASAGIGRELSYGARQHDCISGYNSSSEELLRQFALNTSIRPAGYMRKL